MVPGFTDTDCRIAEFRSRELRGTAEQQRSAALVHQARPERASLTAGIARQIHAIAGGMRRRVAGARSPEAAGATARITALGIGQ